MSIVNALLNIQAELKAPKSQYNSFGKYNYRSSEDILEAVKPLLVKNNVALVTPVKTEVIAEDVYIVVTAKLIDDKGNEISADGYAREPKEKAGMSVSQITGATMSYAKKYALGNLFCIDDTKDADSLEGEGTKKHERPKDDKEKNIKLILQEGDKKKVTPITIQRYVRETYNGKKLEELTVEQLRSVYKWVRDHAVAS